MGPRSLASVAGTSVSIRPLTRNARELRGDFTLQKWVEDNISVSSDPRLKHNEWSLYDLSSLTMSVTCYSRRLI
jgi:hypothetical protein